MNVRNAPVHDMACVMKSDLPPVWRWKFCEGGGNFVSFSMEKSNQFRE